MDLKQRKLNKSEWESIEVPVSQAEQDILKLITEGFHNVNIRLNNNNCILAFLKIENTPKMEDYLFVKYFQDRVNKIEKLIQKNTNGDYKCINVDTNIQIKSADKIRLERNDEATLKKQDVYEYVLIGHVEKIVNYRFVESNIKLFTFHYYTLYKLIRNTITGLNKHVVELCNKVLEKFADEVEMSVIIENAVEFIEKNESLLKYSDMELYAHQKEIFTICKSPVPKLVLYMAPTGTGKTLTPIGLSETHRVIFVCAARHVGVALAKAGISAKKKIAFAFGCASASDIRLHFYAAKEYSKNKKTGGIGKVDNSVGDDVEIMICDIKSYLPAMYYMKSFNRDENLIVYWDEPTITMDYPEHEFHEIIKKNWKENLIPNMVLSSATLPKFNELELTVPDFKDKFKGAEVFSIISHDCKKSIPIVNPDGFVVLPHYLNSDYDEIMKIANHCDDYLTILRYFDLKEVVDFIGYVNAMDFTNNKMRFERHFETLDDINMKNIKMYYIKLLKNINPGVWTTIYASFTKNRKPRIVPNDKIDTKGNKVKSQSTTTTTTTTGVAGVYVTTKDANTLTDGPTIFITDEIEKIAKFCIQQANIPSIVMDELMKKIEFNNVLNDKLSTLENNLEYIKEQAEKSAQNSVSSSHAGVKVQGRNKSTKDLKKLNRESSDDNACKGDIAKITAEINGVRAMIKHATLNDTFVPNKKHHLEKWAEGLNTTASFTSNIEEDIVSEIMLLNGIEDTWKVLLMMGIGVFINHENIKYTEIMKQLADEQKLYMIIASSDYIYGTNYQFCHGYLSKDLKLTQEKLIQAMGRVGRNNVQQTYTLRFRDNQQILKLFTSETEKPEIINMNLLFNSKKVVWTEGEYKVIEEDKEEEDDEEEEEEHDEREYLTDVYNMDDE
jgi:hypothetical protein